MYQKFAVAVLATTCVLDAAFAAEKPSADVIIAELKAGNQRFVEGKSTHRHADAERLKLAAEENQKDYAVATVLSCSDSRVPVEVIFDVGIMDIFVVRVPGNVASTDEAAGIEYGVNHVETPVVVVLGHTNCGAVTATVNGLTGHGHKLETNIPKLLKPIKEVVKDVMKDQPELKGEELIEYCAVENVYCEIDNILDDSPEMAEAVKAGQVRMVGALYDLKTGIVNFLPERNDESIKSSRTDSE